MSLFPTWIFEIKDWLLSIFKSIRGTSNGNGLTVHSLSQQAQGSGLHRKADDVERR